MIAKNYREHPVTRQLMPVFISSETTGYSPIKVPSSANWPESPDTPTAFMIELPEIPYLLDPSNKPFKLYIDSISTENLLTSVSNEPTLNNTYRLPDPKAARCHLVQVSGNLADKIIHYEYWGLGGIFDASEFNYFNNTSIYTQNAELQNLNITNAHNFTALNLITIDIPIMASDGNPRILIKEFYVKKPFTAYIKGIYQKYYNEITGTYPNITIVSNIQISTRIEIYQNNLYTIIKDWPFNELSGSFEKKDIFFFNFLPGRYRLTHTVSQSVINKQIGNKIELYTEGVFGQYNDQIDTIIQLI